jgi:mutator protein MutT
MPEKPFRLAVKAVILDDAGRSLLIRRSLHNRNFVGKWEWPGGKSEPGEPFDEALAREVLEETGLLVEITGLVGAISFEMPAARVILLCLETRVTRGDLKLSEEHDSMAWVSPPEYSAYELPDSARAIMLEYAAKKGSRT